jgi:DNA-directed RNA polymerase specialized sigma24 family protein
MRETKSVERIHFEEETLPYLDVLLSSAQWLTMRSSHAEELVSGTMAHAYRNWNLTEEPVSIKARLFRALFKTFSDSNLRSRKAPWLIPKRRHHDDLEDSVVLQSQDHDLGCPELNLLQTVPTVTVRDAVSRLSARSRFIMLLLFREHFSYAEIGYITGLRLDSTKATLGRLRRLVPRYLIRQTEGAAIVSDHTPASLAYSSPMDDDLCTDLE